MTVKGSGQWPTCDLLCAQVVEAGGSAPRARAPAAHEPRPAPRSAGLRTLADLPRSLKGDKEELRVGKSFGVTQLWPLIGIAGSFTQACTRHFWQGASERRSQTSDLALVATSRRVYVGVQKGFHRVHVLVKLLIGLSK